MEGVGRVGVVLEVEGAGLVGVVLVGAGLVGVVLVGAGLVGALLVGAGLVEVVFFGAGLVGALLVGALVVGVTRTGIELVAGAGNKPSDPAGVRERVGEGVREEECRGTTLSALTGPLDFVGTFAPLAGDCPLWEEL
jgi:hypothetical protein